jgi:serine/threonine protein kinase
MPPNELLDGQHRRITFVEALGKGGFGSVFLADIRSQSNFEQRLAVKVLNEEMRDNEEVMCRQRDEARLLAQLNHDNIVKVFDLLEIDGRPAVLMEYVPGVDAGRLVAEGPIPPRAALEIAGATANALHAANTTESPFTGRALQVIHRDVKPSNLLVSEHGTVKVLDFGIARADFDRESETRSVAFGTARYMAPEQWLNDGVTAAVDVFALGVTMLELLSGRPAERFPLRTDKFDAGRDKQISALRDPRWGTVWWRQLEELLQDMLSFDPADRPSAEEVQELCIVLSEKIGGMSLGRFAKAKVPLLMKARRARMQGVSLLPSADLEMTTPQDPSILTGSKSFIPAGSPNDHYLGPVMGPGWWLQALLSLGIALSLWWFLAA